MGFRFPGDAPPGYTHVWVRGAHGKLIRNTISTSPVPTPSSSHGTSPCRSCTGTGDTHGFACIACHGTGQRCYNI